MGAQYPGHSWQVVSQGKSSLAHKGMLYAGKVMTATALRMYENSELIRKARAELDQHLEGETYLPIPADVHPRAISELASKG